MARWLGVDHGLVRLGVAVGDEEARIATPVEQLTATPPAQVIEHVARLVKTYDARGIVVGWPLNDDDTEGPQGRLARQFAIELAGALAIDVRLWNEHLSSFEADLRLRGLHTRKGKKLRHDAVAAAATLEDFLTRDGPATAVKATEAQPKTP